MRISSGFRAALIALTALTGVSLASAARADEGTIRISVVKAGWVIGGSGGSGVLNFHGRSYPLSIGGISYGIVFGASQTDLRGRVRNIRRPSDVAGVYGAAGAGLAVGARRIGDRADQPERRDPGAERPAGRVDRQRGFERAGDFDAVERCRADRGGRRMTPSAFFTPDVASIISPVSRMSVVSRQRRSNLWVGLAVRRRQVQSRRFWHD